MCPQFNVLFEHLTVEEHLWFFASLKRTPPSKVREEVDTFMKNVGLADKAGCFASNLSGMFNCYICFLSLIKLGVSLATFPVCLTVIFVFSWITVCCNIGFKKLGSER